MRVSVGDRLLVRAHRIGEGDRQALILDVLGKDGGPPYRVRWSDNHHEGLMYPDRFAEVKHFAPVDRG